MSALLVGILVVGGGLLFIVLIVVGMYNALVAMRNQVKNAWSQIDVQLKRRYDLIPNLVETVKGYAKHEREVFENVTKARSACMAATGPADAAKAENFLSQTLKSLFAVAEAYPELKANQNFLALQEELTSTENKVSFARQFYNDTVMRYNTKIQTVPSNIIAGMFSFNAEQFFQTENAAERVAPKVQF
jgi:LemA protein